MEEVVGGWGWGGVGEGDTSMKGLPIISCQNLLLWSKQSIIHIFVPSECNNDNKLRYGTS